MKSFLQTKNIRATLINTTKWIILIYLILFVPSFVLGIKIGAIITFGVIVLWIGYEANEKHHKKREEHLKSLLRNGGWNEEVINHGLEKIENEQDNR